jgi:hypothetical protein
LGKSFLSYVFVLGIVVATSCNTENKAPTAAAHQDPSKGGTTCLNGGPLADLASPSDDSPEEWIVADNLAEIFNCRDNFDVPLAEELSDYDLLVNGKRVILGYFDRCRAESIPSFMTWSETLSTENQKKVDSYNAKAKKANAEAFSNFIEALQQSTCSFRQDDLTIQFIKLGRSIQQTQGLLLDQIGPFGPEQFVPTNSFLELISCLGTVTLEKSAHVALKTEFSELDKAIHPAESCK